MAMQFQAGQTITRDQLQALIAASPLDNPADTLSNFDNRARILEGKGGDSSALQTMLFQRTGATNEGRGAGDPTSKDDAGYYTSFFKNSDGTYRVASDPGMVNRWVGSRQQDLKNSDHFNPGTLIGSAILSVGFASVLSGITGAAQTAALPSSQVGAMDVAGTVAEQVAAPVVTATPVAAGGGTFVGPGSVFGNTGNSLINTVANGAVRGAATSLVTGGDPLKGAIGGGVGAGIGSTITGTGVVDAAARGAVSGGVNAAVNGGGFGDILQAAGIGGAASGAGTFATTLLPNDTPPVVKDIVGGGVGGATGAGLRGGNVLAGAATGAAAGATTGILTRNGVDPDLANAAGGVVGQTVGQSVGGDSPAIPNPSTPTNPPITPAMDFNFSFGSLLDGLPQFKNLRPEWGMRLAGAGLIDS